MQAAAAFHWEHAPPACVCPDSREGLSRSWEWCSAAGGPLPVCCGKRRMERARKASRGIPEPYEFERVLDEDGAETLAFGRRDRRAALLLPRKHQAITTHLFPSGADAARPIGERTVFGRVGC